MPEELVPDLISIIPLRGGSKGLPGKNTRMLAGKPLYRHAVDQALRVIGNCLISTDIEELHNSPPPKGCTILRRPVALARDETPMVEVLLDLFVSIGKAEGLPKTAVLLQATSPLRGDADIHKALEIFYSGNYDLVMSVTATDKNVWKYGTLEYGTFTSLTDPQNCFRNRQALPEVSRPNGAVYVFSPRQFLLHNGFPTKSIGAVEMPHDRSLDIDTEADLREAEGILENQTGENLLRGVG